MSESLGKALGTFEKTDEKNTLIVNDDESTVAVTVTVCHNMGGVWVQEKDSGRCASVIFDGNKQSHGPAFAIWDNGDIRPLAITHDGVQLSQRCGQDVARFISWDDLFALTSKIPHPV